MPDRGYRLDAGTELPPLLFDDDQAVTLAVALQRATSSGAGVEQAAARALGHGPAAVHAREVLRFDYSATSPTGAGDRRTDVIPAPPRRVEPHHVVTWSGRWYLVAWDLDRQDWRILRIDRITPRAASGPRFAPRDLPGGDVVAFVSGRFQGSEDGSTGWPCRGEVILDLPAAVVLAYTRGGFAEAVGTDRCRLVLASWSWTALAAAFGRFDTDIEVIGPPELRTSFADQSRRYASAAVSGNAIPEFKRR